MKSYLARTGAYVTALIVTATLLVSGAPAQPAPAVPPNLYTQGLLWKVESAETAAPSYVFGTIHLADPRVTRLPPPVRESFDASKSFTMEVKLEPANILLLAQRMIYTDGRDLPSTIGRPLYEKVAAAASTLGVPPEILPLFRPWAVALLLMMPPTDPEKILDQQLYRMAIAQKKSVHQLETVDEQVNVFEGLSESEQVMLLRYALEHRARLESSLQRLIEAYLERDLAALRRLGEEDMAGDPALAELSKRFLERLLDERNVRMAERMEPRIKAGGAFVAVGALHLHGEQGVLAHLAKGGYRVTRVY
jgi:uncharacterized protein